MIGFVLFIVSTILLYILSIPMILISLILKPKGYLYSIAFAIDQLGNVMCAPVFNKILIKSSEYKEYGNPDETISHVTGVNYLANNLTLLGKFLSLVLNKLDKNHVQKAAINEQ